MLECFYDEDLQPLRDNPHMSYEQFNNLKRTKDNDYDKYDVFRWDNSLRILKIMSEELDCLKSFPFPMDKI